MFTSQNARSETEKVQVSGCRSLRMPSAQMSYWSYTVRNLERISCLAVVKLLHFILFFFMRGGMLRVICSFRYFMVGPFILEGVVGKIRKV